MIRKDPVYEGRRIRDWLDQDSGFTTGMVRLVEENLENKPDKAWLTDSWLVRVRDGKGKGKESAAKVVASLANHADLGICLNVSEVQMMDMKRIDHPILDQPIIQTMDQVDVMVLDNFANLPPEQEPFVDLLISRRARLPARMTVVILPERNPQKLPSSMRMFEDRRADLWKG